MLKSFFNTLCALAMAFGAQTVCAKTTIQQLDVEGVQVWLVKSETIPMVSVEVGFRAGSVFDPVGQEGVAALTAAMMTEGTSAYDAMSYKKALERLGSGVSFSADVLNISGKMTSLKEHVEPTFALFAQAMKQPRFEVPDFLRLQQATLAAIDAEQESPDAVAGRLFSQALYQSHGYAHAPIGLRRTVEGLSAPDVAAYFRAHITKANMVMSVVGAISEEEVVHLVRSYLHDLPAGEARNKVDKAPQFAGLALTRQFMDTPQSSVIMGHKGIDRHHPDYFAAYAMNYILGGGGFASRLMEEVREKRGLTYGIRSSFMPLPQGGSFSVRVQTKNADVQKVINLTKKEMRKIATKGVTNGEYQAAMDFLLGSFPLRIDSNSKLLGYLTAMQMEDLGADYLETWVSQMKAVTREDIQRVAQELLHPDDMVITIVGGAVKE